MGTVYRRGRIFWIQYSQYGKAIRESTKTQDRAEARRLLREREGQMAKGARPVTTRGTWLQAPADLVTFYEAYRSRDPVEASYRLAHLDRYFKATRLSDLDSSMITRYVVRRQAQGAANGTIGVELATLRKALRLAHENGKLASLAVIRAPKPAALRSGFFEDEAFEAVCQELPVDLQIDRVWALERELGRIIS